MKINLSAALASIVLGAVPVLSHAQDAAKPAEAPAAAPADPLSFNIGVVSDYRYRGISQTRLKPAIQGGVDYAFASGFYVGAWASSIKWVKDAGGDSNVEVDVYGGYKGEISKDLTFDVGVLTYQYPSNHLGTNANTYEVYGALTFGPATVKYSHSASNLFGFPDSKNSGYLEAAATFDLGSGFSIAPHVGYQKVSHNGDFSYTDYSVTGTKDFGNGLTVSLAAIGTSTKSVPGSYAYVSPDGKNLGKATAVLGVKYSF